MGKNYRCTSSLNSLMIRMLAQRNQRVCKRSTSSSKKQQVKVTLLWQQAKNQSKLKMTSVNKIKRNLDQGYLRTPYKEPMNTALSG